MSTEDGSFESPAIGRRAFLGALGTVPAGMMLAGEGSGQTSAASKAVGLSLKSLRDQYRRDLYDDFLPFMDRYVIDHELGGFSDTPSGGA